MKDLLKKSIREGCKQNDFVDILSSSYQQPSQNNPYMNVLILITNIIQKVPLHKHIIKT